MKSLNRPRRGRIVAGVCAGLGHRFGLDPWLVRLLFMVSIALPGPQVIAYLILWLIMPSE